MTSHQFRHNGISDRLVAGFTIEQIASMTGHHGDAMIWSAYSHLSLKPEMIVQRQRYVLEEPECVENNYILFGGRILNMDAQLEKRLLKNLRAHRVPGGICSNVTGCRSDMWTCIGCGKFVPDKDQLRYFEEQATMWQDKSEQSGDRRLKQRLAEKEQRIRRLSDENASLKSECELLRGRLFLLMQRQSFE